MFLNVKVNMLFPQRSRILLVRKLHIEPSPCDIDKLLPDIVIRSHVLENELEAVNVWAVALTVISEGVDSSEHCGHYTLHPQRSCNLRGSKLTVGRKLVNARKVLPLAGFGI